MSVDTDTYILSKQMTSSESGKTVDGKKIATLPGRYPCGLMMGDDKAKATVDAMMGGLLSGVSKYSLEKGISTSVLAKKKDLIRQVSLLAFFSSSPHVDSYIQVRVYTGRVTCAKLYVRGLCNVISGEEDAF